jgi:putative SOS response-associated peptidase YedK
MCYSAMIEQSLKSLGITFQARIQLDLFEELFRRRLLEERIRLPKALESEFEEPDSAIEEQIHAHIVAYRLAMNKKYGLELARQEERLAAAERRLLARTTKAATEERRIATNRIAWLNEKLEELTRTQPKPSDARIFPFWYAPVVVQEGAERVIRPMRYHCRGHGKPTTIDDRFPGLYNARTDNLSGYWREQFGVTHAVVMVRAFFENVSKHAYEHRSLLDGEREENLVIEFRPSAEKLLPIACLWDRWQGQGEPELQSFAAITDLPPREVAVTGHDRCIVVLKDENVSSWLNPVGQSDVSLRHVLSDRDPVVFVHRRAS